MMEFFKALPRLEPYGNPLYFIYLILALAPIFVGLFFKKRFPWYEGLVSLIFIILMFTGSKTEQLLSLFIYILWQTVLVFIYKYYRQRANQGWVFYLVVFLAVLPLFWVKLAPTINQPASLFGFLGISYLTFRSVGMIMEMRDGLLANFSLVSFLRFLLFMPTFSSGPIDRYRRFTEDYEQIPERDELLNMLDKAIHSIMMGFFYKFILAYFIRQVLLDPLKGVALGQGGWFNLPTLGVMYLYGLELFFDFAGYSFFALGISNLMGIRCPINFDHPFKSRDLKEFWNRWHMSLSFWFRDFVFMRLVKTLLKNKIFQNRNTVSNVAYLVNMLLMGLWHGVTWYYVAYGLFHAIGLMINDAWLRKKKSVNLARKKAGQPPLPDNRWTALAGMVITFHAVMFSFLIFSGFLNKLWFK
ncbi:D-alanyl-lipoteichoic acid biosynthesis protein DltB [Streptococcus ruminantium]|uniref:D-alanyl-lipoteichoic acid biosynthesis protein DltB n=1 Tax=Streptococcus ruminantium TaxID=1917441 RepID=UPI001F0247CA|nr:D-alanyl-lipoteichoic acid biosynthesis protein DltB [Streptococcus ruminantium]BDD39115.1 D-alanyl transfer protein DltB [Streptococcus ruminantium]